MKDNSSHGGVFVCVSNEIVCSEEPELNVDAEVIWARVSMHGGRTLYVGSFYRQPRTNLDYLKLLDSSIARLDEKNATVILGGDFNLPDIDWYNGIVRTDSSHPQLHNFFLDLMADRGLEQLVDKPTFERNTLDLLLTNSPASVNRTEILPGMCRHHAILSEFALTPSKVKVKPRKILIHRRANLTKLKSEMGEFVDRFTSRDTENMSCNSLWEEFKTNFNRIVDNNVPSKMLRPTQICPGSLVTSVS